MKVRRKCLIGIVALLPFTLMANSILTNHDANNHGDELKDKTFHAVNLVPSQSSDVGIYFHTAASPAYYGGF
jgi:hypothetical protein